MNPNPRRRTGAVMSVAVVGVAVLLPHAGCRRTQLADPEQIGASVGELMASVDESTKGGGATARLPILRMPDELRVAPLWRQVYDGVVRTAYAGGCVQALFAACADGVRTRAFDQCSIGAAMLDGTVTLTYSDTRSCAITAVGDRLSREPNFTLTGPWGGTLAVSSPQGGQTLTKTADGFDYSVPGIRRVLTGPGGHIFFDITTGTTTPIHITGTSRADLVIVSGALDVRHDPAAYHVTLVPDHLTWNTTCNCAVSGRLTGTVHLVNGGKLDGKSAAVTITGCGHADVDVDGDVESVTLDRCATAN